MMLSQDDVFNASYLARFMTFVPFVPKLKASSTSIVPERVVSECRF